MKKSIALLLVLAMLCYILPMATFAAGADERTGATEGPEAADTIKLSSYRWEMDNNALVSVHTNGNADNPPTLDAGSVTNGIFKKACYTLQTKVQLYHDAPWVMEWRSTGNWSGMLFGSSFQSPSDGLIYLFRDPGSKMFAFGEYTGSWNNFERRHDGVPCFPGGKPYCFRRLQYGVLDGGRAGN